VGGMLRIGIQRRLIFELHYAAEGIATTVLRQVRTYVRLK
jgi:hypothetical protein